MREEFLMNKKQYEIIDWDEEMLKQTRYSYYENLCYQLFPETENYKYWLDYFGHIRILKYILKKMELDKHVEPGYSYFLLFAKNVPILLFVLFILYMIYIFIQ